MILPAVINSNFSLLSVLYILPVGIAIYLDLKLVYWSIRTGNLMRFLITALSFAISLAAIAWGIYSVFTNFSFALLFVLMGGGIIFLFTLSSLTYGKEEVEEKTARGKIRKTKQQEAQNGD